MQSAGLRHIHLDSQSAKSFTGFDSEAIVAQLVEQLIRNQCALGTPSHSQYGSLVQLNSAPLACVTFTDNSQQQLTNTFYAYSSLYCVDAGGAGDGQPLYQASSATNYAARTGDAPCYFTLAPSLATTNNMGEGGGKNHPTVIRSFFRRMFPHTQNHSTAVGVNFPSVRGILKDRLCAMPERMGGKNHTESLAQTFSPRRCSPIGGKNHACGGGRIMRQQTISITPPQAQNKQSQYCITCFMLSNAVAVVAPVPPRLWRGRG